MNVKTIFMSGVLDEEIYMEQPERYVVPGQQHKVRKLKNSFMTRNKLQSNGKKI